VARIGPGEGQSEPLPAPIARVLIADQGLIRLGLRVALGRAPGVEICAEAADAGGAISEAGRHRPDVCLVGWDLPGGAISAVRAITEAGFSSAVVMIASTRRMEDLLAAIEAGAMGYVPGDASAEGLRRVIRAVLAHEAVVPRSMVRDLIAHLHDAASETREATGREAEVLAALRRGESTAEIAQGLGISPVTVRRHISDLVRKLGVADRAALVQGHVGEPSPDRVQASSRGLNVDRRRDLAKTVTVE
jgi:DNA-binding NarL/FixJ family response regulator